MTPARKRAIAVLRRDTAVWVTRFFTYLSGSANLVYKSEHPELKKWMQESIVWFDRRSKVATCTIPELLARRAELRHRYRKSRVLLDPLQGCSPEFTRDILKSPLGKRGGA